MSLLSKIQNKEAVIGVVGLGYVGLPLAVEFGKKFKTLGFDISQERIDKLRAGNDQTLECSPAQLSSSTHLNFSTNQRDLQACEIYIITVPTPIDQNKTPDLRPLISASKTVGKVLKPGNLVIYESTVYPGCTEEDCVPILERESGLTFNSEFFCGYSPERINPGDKEHTVSKILKVTSGSTPEFGEIVDGLYKTVITAGTHLAPTIKVAEAAKVIENAQRDVNIAFVNELAKVFKNLELDTHAVLEAAGTKWNFLPFKPGLVGGHCIGVDPYYLAHKAQQTGYLPEIILAGRRLNDGMGKYVASEVVKLMIKRSFVVKGANVLMLGMTFKENCPDIRNSRAIDVYKELQSYDVVVSVYDPWADHKEVKHEFGIELSQLDSAYDAVVLVVSHQEFLELDIKSLINKNGVIFDVKGFLDVEKIDGRL